MSSPPVTTTSAPVGRTSRICNARSRCSAGAGQVQRAAAAASAVTSAKKIRASVHQALPSRARGTPNAAMAGRYGKCLAMLGSRPASSLEPRCAEYGSRPRSTSDAARSVTTTSAGAYRAPRSARHMTSAVSGRKSAPKRTASATTNRATVSRRARSREAANASTPAPTPPRRYAGPANQAQVSNFKNEEVSMCSAKAAPAA
jgi:hypothetical protein